MRQLEKSSRTYNILVRAEKRKGTRHLAALGLSEVSDAITIIVSEETGRITIARNNTLSDKLNRKELEEVLFSIFKKD